MATKTTKKKKVQDVSIWQLAKSMTELQPDEHTIVETEKPVYFKNHLHTYHAKIANMKFKTFQINDTKIFVYRLS